MYGWRTRIGLITPPDNLLIEPELYEVVPDGVSIHSTRLDTIDLEAMPRRAESEAEQYGRMGVDVLAYACNISSFHEGPGSDEKIAAGLEEASGLPATTASTAMVRALDALNVDSVTAVTPYNPSDNESLRAFLEGNGVAVDAMAGLDLSATDEEDVMEISEETAQDTYNRVVDAYEAESDAVLVTATNLACLETIETLEADLGVPVVASNQAILWHSLSLSGIDPTVPGAGRLLAGGD